MSRLFISFKKKKNEKLEAIYQREARIDMVCGILMVPMLYVLTILMCVL